MFEVGNLRIFFLSRHVSLRQACDLVTKERVLDYIERCTRALKLLGISEGTMAVAGLNPHSGENGLFEEVDFVGRAPLGLTRCFILQVRENTTQYFLFIMTRGILPPKHWILKGQFRLP